ncbi:MAG: cation:proton antiporter [Cyanobacteria bacterium J06642_2]
MAAASSQFIIDLTVVLGAAALGGYVANRVKQPVLLGYLLTGGIVGPFGLKLLSDVEQIKGLAEIGVAFLLFALGVEFSLAELKRVRDIAFRGSFLQIGLTIAFVSVFVVTLGWVELPQQGIFLGAILSLSSTAVVLKTLSERGEINTLHGQIMLTILIVQDLALGLMLALLPVLNEPANLVSALTLALGKVAIFLVGAFIIGRWVVPRLIAGVASTNNSELFLLTVTALCLSIALVTAALGLSIEMGAFVAGLMIAEIDYADQALDKILPLRDTFASLFFASVGMLINPDILIENFSTIIGLVAIVMVGKASIIFPIILRFGYSFKTAVIASLGLNQIGEFSFVLALNGLNLGLLSEEKYLLILGTTAITLVLTPTGMKLAPELAEHLSHMPLLAGLIRQWQGHKAFSVPESIHNHIVVAGYGRVGSIVVKLLRNEGYPVLVVDNNEAAIQRLRSLDIPYIFGDADAELVIEKMHLDTAKALSITLTDPASTRLLLKRALEYTPNLDIVARSHTESEIDVLTQLGATEVVQPEFEGGLEIGAHLLATLGDPAWKIQAIIQAMRTDRYMSVRPESNPELLKQAMSKATSDMQKAWIELDINSPLNGLELAAAKIRSLTGVAVMAISQNNTTTYYPQHHQLDAGDRLLVVGRAPEVQAFRDLATGRVIFAEDEYRSWLTLAESSPLVGLSPGQVSYQFDLAVRAVRRHGTLHAAAETIARLQAGDCVLLEGKPDILPSLASEI